MPESERDIEKFFVETVEGLGGVALKLEVKSRRGWSDRLAILPGGVVVFVELKKSKGKIAKLQKIRHTYLEALNHNVVYLRSKFAVQLWGQNADWMYSPKVIKSS